MVDTTDETEPEQRAGSWLLPTISLTAAAAVWVSVLVSTWPAATSSRWILLAGLVAAAAATAGSIRLGWGPATAAPVVWTALGGCAVITWWFHPTADSGGAQLFGLEPARLAHLTLLAALAMPLLPAGRWLRVGVWVLGFLALWSALPFAVGAVLATPIEDMPLSQGLWSSLPQGLHPPFVALFVYLPLASVVMILAHARRWRREHIGRLGLIAGLLWLLALVPPWALGVRLLRMNHLVTPVDLVFPPRAGVGTTAVVLADGTPVIVSTAGYADLTAEERDRGPAFRILARGLKPADPAEKTRLWVTVLDEHGRSVRDMDASDLDVIHQGRSVTRFDFDRTVSDVPPSLTPPFIWIANSGENTVSKLSTRTGEELDRFAVGRDPSRTAVDLDGNVYVASRDSHELTKIAAHDCRGSGCVQFTVPTCKGARGVAVDAQNRVWVGGEGKGGTACLQLHEPTHGEVLEEYGDVKGRIYGLALDARNQVWGILNPGDQLVRLGRSGSAVEIYDPPDGAPLYGIAVDLRGNVWIADNGRGGVLRFDPSREIWDRFGDDDGRGRGVAADAAGNIWVADSARDLLLKFDGGTGDVLGRYDTGGGEPVGVAIDSEQFVWVVNRGSDTATRIEPVRGGIVGVYPVGRGPYTYSDMTGYALNTFVARRGLYTVAFHAEPLDLELVQPPDGSLVATTGVEPLPLAVAVEAYDPDDPLVSVQYTVDGLVVGRAEADPFHALWSYTEIDEGPHVVEAVGTTESGWQDSDAATVVATRTFGTVALELVQDGVPVDHLPRAIELVVDSSGSMWGWAGDGLKIEVARRAVSEILTQLPPDTTVALRAYGHRDKTCTDSELLVPPGPLDVASLEAALDGLTPHGRTPIARSLELAARDLQPLGGGRLGDRIVVLLSDGIETCRGDPCAVAADLASSEVQVRANVVGFALGADVDPASLRCMAEVTGGIYVEADDADTLAEGLARAVEVLFTLVDDDGRVVHMGSLSEPSVRAPTGSYRVRFGTSAATLESDPFVLGPDETVVVQLDASEGRIPTTLVKKIP